MFALIFTRLTNGTEESIFLLDTYDSREDAHESMRKEWVKRISDMGWDADYSYIYDDQAFCGTEDMYDTCRYYIFDTEHPVGFDNDTAYEFCEDDE